MAELSILSERQRPLTALTFAEGQTLSRDIPCDSVYKRINLRLSGAVQTTFGSGTPVADSFSTFDNIIPRIDVIVGGERVVKSVRPHAMRIQQLFETSILAERKSSAGAAAALGNMPTVDGGFVYGTTTQYTTVAEFISLPFEHVYCDPGVGREKTWLNLRNAPSAEIKLTCASYSKLLGSGNTAPVTYGNSTLVIDIFTVEAQDMPDGIPLSDWKQTTRVVPITAETSEFAIEINRGNDLSGVMLIVRNGAAGSATTATGKMPTNIGLTKISLQLNGQSIVKSTTFAALQAENRARYGVQAPLASNVSALDGVAHMNFLARKNIKTALKLGDGSGVKNCQLLVSSFAGETYPLEVTIMTEEITQARV